MAALVRGEASESEDDNVDAKTDILATEVSGEATESDEDLYENNRSNGSVTDILCYMNNLLQRKLIENNISLWRSIASFMKLCVTSASQQLYKTDQLLIKSQVSMQSAISSIKLSRGNIKLLHDKSKDVFSTSYIPKIKLKTEKNSY